MSTQIAEAIDLPSDEWLRSELAEAFLRFLARESVLYEPEDLGPYETDGLSVFRRVPLLLLLVMLPETIEQVQQILAVCRTREVPVVARGAGTGLSGGAMPLPNGVLLGLAKFNKILELDPERRVARVQPGVRNLAISEAAAPPGLYYAPDPSSQIACTIGGNVAENAGGVHCLKYGLTVHNVLAGLEMMDDLAIRTTEDFAKCGYPVGAAAILLCELDGTLEEVEEQFVQVREVMQSSGATRIHVAANESERLKLWKTRKSAFPATGRLAPDYYCRDGTIPRRRLSEVLKRISELSEHYGLAVANVFHAGDGNLHPLVLFDANKPGEWEKTEQFGGKILELCVDVGGTITGEHGVGVEKINQMCVQFQPLELTQFHAVKAAFDPQGLLNPGKAVPTLQRCAEFGAMHVHGGNLPFPELERF